MFDRVRGFVDDLKIPIFLLPGVSAVMTEFFNVKELESCIVVCWSVVLSGNIGVIFTEVERHDVETGCFEFLWFELCITESSLSKSEVTFPDLLAFSFWFELIEEELFIITVSVKCKVPQPESVVDKGSTTMYGL
jgi:hypothetical protein